MEAYAQSGIEIRGSKLRYAEVEHYGARLRLLRLGSLDFEFDAAAVLYESGDFDQLGTLAEAITEVFQGANSTSVRLSLHPSDAYTFLSPQPRGLPREERAGRLQEEAAMLAGAERPLRVSSEPCWDDGEVSWNHVLALEEEVVGRIEHVLGVFPRKSVVSTHQAAAAVTARPEQVGRDLVVGWYDSHMELSLLQDSSLQMLNMAPAGSAIDSGYFSLVLLERLGIRADQIDRIHVFGEHPEPEAFAPLSKLFGCSPQALNPLSVIDLDPDGIDAKLDLQAYVPCIGAAIV